MSGLLIITTAILYAIISVDQIIKGNIGLAMAYGGYSFANFGLFAFAK